MVSQPRLQRRMTARHNLRQHQPTALDAETGGAGKISILAENLTKAAYKT
jgi:hypothetical protein